MNVVTRRNFARAAGIATAASYSRIMGANDRVRMGYIGVGNRGDQVHDAFLETGSNETVAVLHGLCDQKVASQPEEVQGISRSAGRQGRGRGGDRDSGPLACVDVHRRLQR